MNLLAVMNLPALMNVIVANTLTNTVTNNEGITKPFGRWQTPNASCDVFSVTGMEPQDTAAEIVLNRMVQVVASPTRQAFRQADMHTAPLGRASGLHISAQEHFRLANIPGRLIIGHKMIRVPKGKYPDFFTARSAC